MHAFYKIRPLAFRTGGCLSLLGWVCTHEGKERRGDFLGEEQPSNCGRMAPILRFSGKDVEILSNPVKELRCSDLAEGGLGTGGVVGDAPEIPLPKYLTTDFMLKLFSKPTSALTKPLAVQRLLWELVSLHLTLEDPVVAAKSSFRRRRWPQSVNSKFRW
jgi:hypothetical protein